MPFIQSRIKLPYICNGKPVIELTLPTSMNHPTTSLNKHSLHWKSEHSYHNHTVVSRDKVGSTQDNSGYHESW